MSENIGPDRPEVFNAMDVQPARVEWLWPQRIPLGKLSILDGDPDQGKSTLTIDMAARVTTASLWPDGSKSDRYWSGSVLIINGEDGAADTMVPRLMAAHADLALVNFLDSVSYTDAEGRRAERSLSLPGDIGIIDQAIEATSSTLVVIDPFTAFLADTINAYRDHDVRRALMPLARLADRTGVSILAVRHLTKGGGGNALYRGNGSIGIIGAARSGMLVATDPDDDNRRVLAVTKSNLARKPSALAFHLFPDEEHDCARIAWDGPVKFKAGDLLAQPDSPNAEETGAIADAVDFLSGLLDKQDLWVKDVRDEAKAAEVSWATARRAKARLNIRSVRCGRPGEKVSGWKWHLPQTPIVSTFGEGAQTTFWESAGQGGNQGFPHIYNADESTFGGEP